MQNNSYIKSIFLTAIIAFAMCLQANAQEVTPRYYTVKQGEGLYRAAANNNVTMADIRKWNNLTSDVLTPGQRLIVGYDEKNGRIQTQPKPTPSQTSQTPTTQGTKQPKYYTVPVQPKEGLLTVANKHGVTMAEIRKWNNLTSDVLTPGQRLIVGWEYAPAPIEQKPDNTVLYQQYISKGDDAFDEERYDDAKNYYEQALSVKPDSYYPKKKLEIITSLTVQPSSTESYQDAIVQGAKYSSEGKYSEAKKAYENALKIKPGDAYAGMKLEEINSKLEELNAQEETGRNEKEEEEIRNEKDEETEETEEVETELAGQEELEEDGLYYEDRELFPANLYPESEYYYPSRYSFGFYYPGYPDSPTEFNYPAGISDYPGNYYNIQSPYYP